MNTVKELAYAKVNLFLDIQSRRDDGFHDIVTLMQPITLADEVTVSQKPSSKKEIRMFVEGAMHVPVDGRNLAYRAAELYMDYVGVVASVHIHLKKNIPVAAGLAGGSSDAAATLRAMNRLYKKALTQKALLKLAEKLGSDVPFCFMSKPALCEGRGELMRPISVRRTMHMVVSIANEYISTPAAYGALDTMYSNFDGGKPFGNINLLPPLLSYLSCESETLPLLYNIFEDAVLPLCSGAKNIRTAMQTFGARMVLMSGSGPSVYGIFDSEEQAIRAKEELQKEGCRAFYARNMK